MADGVELGSTFSRADRNGSRLPGRIVAEADARTLSERTYEQIRADIQSGKLAPGSKLSTIALKNKYGTSLSTVREALTQLAGNALVTQEGRKGFRVAPVSQDDLQDLIFIRKLLEGAAIARSISFGGDAWESAVVGAYHELQHVEERLAAAIARDGEEEISRLDSIWDEKNDQFHMAVVSACESSRLLQLYRDLYEHTARYRRVTFKRAAPVLRTVDEEHKNIFEAVIARNIEKAQAFSAEHLEGILSYFTK